MKKIIAFVLAAVCVLGAATAFTSCGKQDTLIVATSPDFAPMEFVDLAKPSDEQIVGFDILLANYLAKKMGKTLVIKPMDFDSCMAAVQTGTADVAISGFSWTADRAENFLITDYYVAGENENEQVVITLKDKENTKKNAADFNGMKVGAQGGSLQQLLVQEQLVVAGATIVKYTSLNDALAALKNGTIDALAVAKGNGDAYISQNAGNDKDVAFSGFQFVIEEKYKNNVCLVNKNNQKLCDQINEILAELKNSDICNSWYEACQVYSGISTLDEAGYDENGNKLGETGGAVADNADAAKKKPYEGFLKEIIQGKEFTKQ